MLKLLKSVGIKSIKLASYSISICSGIALIIIVVFKFKKFIFNQNIKSNIYYLSSDSEFLKNSLNSISENFNKYINDSMTSLELYIALVTLILTFFAIFFGISFVSKLRSIEKVKKDMETAPKEFIKKYNKIIVDELLDEVLIEDHLKRYSILQQLQQVHSFENNKHKIFKLLSEREFSFSNNNFFHQNLKIIAEIIIRIDHKSGLEIIYDLINKYNKNSETRLGLFCNYIVSSDDDKQVEKNIEILQRNTTFSEQLATHLSITSNLNNEYVQFMVNNKNDNFINYLLSHYISNIGNIKKLSLSKFINDKKEFSYRTIMTLSNNDLKELKLNYRKILSSYFNKPNRDTMYEIANVIHEYSKLLKYEELSNIVNSSQLGNDETKALSGVIIQNYPNIDIH